MRGEVEGEADLVGGFGAGGGQDSGVGFELGRVGGSLGGEEVCRVGRSRGRRSCSR